MIKCNKLFITWFVHSFIHFLKLVFEKWILNSYSNKGHEVWVKPIEPIVSGQHSYAVVNLDRDILGESLIVSYSD